MSTQLQATTPDTTKTNPCGKTVKSWAAYEVWRDDRTGWTWYVLKKYQSPKAEASNPLAIWFCMVNGFEWEGGDVYKREITRNARRLQGGELAEALAEAKENAYF
jgi:hypothetical protein